MGRKSNRMKEVTGMEVSQIGVKSRRNTRNLSKDIAGSKKRRVITEEFHVSYITLRSRKLFRSQRKTISSVNVLNSSRLMAACNHYLDEVTSSRCSSNGSNEIVRESLRSVDLEGRYGESAMDSNNGEREMSPSSSSRSESGTLDSENSLSASSFDQRTRPNKMPLTPPAEEIEEFFSRAEKDLQKQFQQRYNFDIAKGIPLEGRYEWVSL